jgi:hypothetical protein
MRSAQFVGFLISVLAAGCGGGVEGRYVGQGETFFESLTFRSDDKVEVVFINQTAEGAYEVDGNTVTMTAPNGDKTAFVLEGDGCLTNSLIGTYCRDGSAPDASASSASSSGGLAQRYEAQAQEGRIALEFGDATKVRVTMMPSGPSDIPDRMSFDVGYDVSGDEITINLPGNERLMLTRAGNDLEGTMNGETVRFVRR